MKKIAILTATLLLSLISCNKKGCTDELANNYEEDAKKDDASCTYNWDQYLGTYSGESGECSTPDGMHTVTITKGPTKDEMIISNFADLGIDIRATIDGNEFSYSQTQEGVGYQGTGYIVDGEITVNAFFCEGYNWPDECDDESCVFMYSPN